MPGLGWLDRTVHFFAVKVPRLQFALHALHLSKEKWQPQENSAQEFLTCLFCVFLCLPQDFHDIAVFPMQALALLNEKQKASQL